MGSPTHSFVLQIHSVRGVSTTYFLSCAFLPKTAESITFMVMGCFPGHASDVSSQYGLFTSLVLKLHSAEQAWPIALDCERSHGKPCPAFLSLGVILFQTILGLCFQDQSQKESDDTFRLVKKTLQGYS